MATVNREFTAASEGPFQWNDTNFNAYTLTDTSTGDEFYLRKQSGAFEFGVKDNSDNEDWLALRMIIDTGKVEFPQGITGIAEVALDLGDDGSNESNALEEIATTNDPGNVFTEPSSNKLLISLDQSGSWYLPYVDGNSDMILEEAIRLQAKGSTSSDVPQVRLERKDDANQNMFVQFEESGGDVWRGGVLQGEDILSFEHFAGGVTFNRALELHTGFANPVELRPNGESKIEGFKSTVTSYTSGWTGSGFKLDETGPSGKPDFLELGHLSIRGTLRARELEIRQLTFSKGPFGITPGGGKLGSVSSSSHTNVSNSLGTVTEQQWTFENSNDQPTEHGLAQGDRLLAQQFDPSSQTVISQVRAVVDETAAQNANLDAYTVNVSVDQTYTVPSTGEQTDPYEFIVVASSNTGRDSLIYNDPYGPFVDVLDGLSDFNDWDNRTPAVRMGELGGLSGLSGRGLFVELDDGEITNAGNDFKTNIFGYSVNTSGSFAGSRAFTVEDFSSGDLQGYFWGDGSTVYLEGALSSLTIKEQGGVPTIEGAAIDGNLSVGAASSPGNVRIEGSKQAIEWKSRSGNPTAPLTGWGQLFWKDDANGEEQLFAQQPSGNIQQITSF